MLTLLQLLEGQRREPADNPVISELNAAENAADFVANAEQLLAWTYQKILTQQESATISAFYHDWQGRRL